uniref:Uncharacterized protein n=1 Tax=Romanomermis culicivorax TaxID=13658 RepID=A0A915L9G9_ROMCU
MSNLDRETLNLEIGMCQFVEEKINKEKEEKQKRKKKRKYSGWLSAPYLDYPLDAIRYQMTAADEHGLSTRWLCTLLLPISRSGSRHANQRRPSDLPRQIFIATERQRKKKNDSDIILIVIEYQPNNSWKNAYTETTTGAMNHKEKVVDKSVKKR